MNDFPKLSQEALAILNRSQVVDLRPLFTTPTIGEAAICRAAARWRVPSVLVSSQRKPQPKPQCREADDIRDNDAE